VTVFLTTRHLDGADALYDWISIIGAVAWPASLFDREAA
jgi:hypothetical protein